MSENKRGIAGYVVTGLGLGAAGLGWAVWGSTSDVTFSAVEGISVFAVLYLIAQSSVRVTELVVNELSLLDSPEKTRQEAL